MFAGLVMPARLPPPKEVFGAAMLVPVFWALGIGHVYWPLCTFYVQGAVHYAAEYVCICMCGDLVAGAGFEPAAFRL